MNLIEHWGSGIPRIIDKVKASGLQEPEFIGGEVDLRINIYRGQVDTNNANSTKNGANGVKCGADDGTNGTEVPLNKEKTQIEKLLQIIENFHHFAWLVVFTKFSQKNWHSPLDSANNRCYITPRTKERGSEKRRAPKESRVEVRSLRCRCSKG